MNRIFNDQQTAKYIKAVDILLELLQAEGFFAVDCAYAEAICEERKRAFAEKIGVESIIESRACFRRLQGKQRCSCEKMGTLNAPINDHLSEIKKDGKTIAILAQPYKIDFEELIKIKPFYEKTGIECNIGGYDSWYFPGRTLTAVYTRSNEKELNSSIFSMKKEKIIG